MKKNLNALILMLLFCSLSFVTVAQRNWRIGIGYSIGFSDFYNQRYSSQPINNKLSLLMSQGGFLEFEKKVTNRFEFYFQSGLQQRGAVFQNSLDNFKPRYRDTYIDVGTGLNYLLTTASNGITFLASAGITEHNLIRSKRIYDSGGELINSDLNNTDVGLQFGVGARMTLFGNQTIQCKLVGNPGFIEVFKNNLYTNGIRGKNIFCGLRVTYFI